MDEFIVKPQLGIETVHPVADEDTIGVIDRFIHKYGYQLSTARARVIQWERLLTYWTKDFSDITLFQVNIKGYSALDTVNRAKGHQTHLPPLPHFDQNALISVEIGPGADKIVTFGTVTLIDDQKRRYFAECFRSLWSGYEKHSFFIVQSHGVKDFGFSIRYLVFNNFGDEL